MGINYKADMSNKDFQKSLIDQIEKKLSIRVINSQIPPQGMSSSVFFCGIRYGERICSKVWCRCHEGCLGARAS